MTIRRMQETDLPQVSALERLCFSMPWKQEDFADALQKEYYIFAVAKEHGVVLGQAGLILSLEEADLTNVSVHPDYRGRQIASGLLEFLFKEGKEKGVQAFTLEVRESNLAAIGLYQKFGFQAEGIRKNFYEKPTENAIIMWKR